MGEGIRMMEASEMKRVALLFVALALWSCNLSGPGSAKPPTRVGIAGAHALYLQEGGSGKRLAGKSVVTSTGATLYRVNSDLSTGSATWTAADGSTVTVDITRVAQVGAYLFVEYTEGGQTADVIVDASGNINPLSPVPANWSMIREQGGTAYYVAGGLQKLTLATGAAAVVDDSAGDALSGDSWLFVRPNGDVYYLGASLFKCYHPNGASQAFTAHTGAQQLYASLPGGGSKSSATWAVQDDATGDLFLVWFTAPIQYAKIIYGAEQGSPTDYIAAGTVVPTASTGPSNPGMVGDGSLSMAANVFADVQTMATFAPNGSGGLTVNVQPRPAGEIANATLSDAQYGSGLLYVGYTYSGTPKVASVDPSTGAGTVLMGDATMVGWTVVKDQLFYTDAGGTYQVAATAGATPTLYSGAAVSVQAVTP